MRGGATVFSVHQTLTSEAASVLKLSLGLASKRGHAQVTPLHVACALLSSRASDLLRRACLRSQKPYQGGSSSHPLQCRALELCFNVALNRLPTITASLPSGPYISVQQPSLSNALVAALKRAQAHQRRGSIEQQQQQQQQNQPLLAAKVELEQLVLSILDDPSVSRVMREAGFSSTAVKTSMEDSLSSPPVFQLPSAINASTFGLISLPPSPHHQLTSFWPSNLFNIHSHEKSPLSFSLSPHPKNSPPQEHQQHAHDLILTPSPKEDQDNVKPVIEVMLRKKRSSTVIVGDSPSTAEGLVMGLKERIERGEVPSELKSISFVKLQLQADGLKFMDRDDVEKKYLSEMRRKVELSLGAIVYVGDLKWAVHDDEETIISTAVGHLVEEIGKLILDNRREATRSPPSPRVWVVGTASFPTYMKCQMKFQPPLDLQWGLQPVSLPSNGLHSPSMSEPRIPFLKFPLSAKEAEDKLTCCEECTFKFEKKAGLKPANSSPLPSWLQPLRTDPGHEEDLMELRRKWSKLCQTLHQGNKQIADNNWNNLSFYNNNNNNQINPNASSKQHSFCWPANNTSATLFPDKSSISFTGLASKPANSIPRFRRQTSPQTFIEPNLSSLRDTENKEVKITLSLGNQPDSLGRTIKRAEICRVIKDYVPWQSENVPGIVEALIDSTLTKETWLLIQGNDRVGKLRLASAIAESIFGSVHSVLYLNMRPRNNSKEADLSDQSLIRTLGSLQNSVVLVEDAEFAHSQFMKYLIDRFEAGKSTEYGNKEGINGRLVFMLANGDPAAGYDAEGDHKPAMRLVLKVNYDNKRKAEEDGFLNKLKIPRILDGKKGSLTCKKLVSKQIDLNVSAEEEDHDEEDISPVSSDLTRENTAGGEIQSRPRELMELIEHRFTFNRSPARDREMREHIALRIRGSFDEAVNGGGSGSGGGNKKVKNGITLGIEDRVLEEVLGEGGGGGDSFIHNVFEKWLRDIFQACLAREKVNWGNGISLVRLCLVEENQELVEGRDYGFMSTNLPTNVSASFR
ncbi:hypothetical protein SAY87_009479 [Trapa incisa]|uniref:Clp R domain-containing protein n=1 Tax=Trapa incisa TaxID=236973 RepID=A0AAN7JZ15_9MYRT|nr:hypothetical protein SAY87_009479 [Trapa incisa]